MNSLMAIILAAGEGKRMKSKNSKVVHEVCGKPIVKHVCAALDEAGISDKIVIVGHKAEQVKECLNDTVKYAIQEKQLGTGHAVMQANQYFMGKKGQIFVICGDTPLISTNTIANSLKLHIENNNDVTVITAKLLDPTGYGRIIRTEDNSVQKIVEHKDAVEEEKNVNEINSGIYCFEITALEEALKSLTNENSQGEYYLTDTIEILLKKGKKIGAYKISDSDEILGINDRIQLAQAEKIMRKRIIQDHMKKGVTFIDSESTYIGKDVIIGMDTIIYPSTHIEGNSDIGDDCRIGPNVRLVNSTIANQVEINNSVVLQSFVDEKTHIGPFAYIRPESKIGKNVKIGDFVEIKKSHIGDNSKISHLTYVGDAEVGQNVNLGCGVVVVNYDGTKKHKTIIEDNAFIGCNSNLVSPVVIKKNSYVAAGSTITEEVPENSLAIARSRQVNKENWVTKRSDKK